MDRVEHCPHSGSRLARGLAAAAFAVAIPAAWIFMPDSMALSQETAQQREARLVEGAKREGKVIWWTPGAARHLEQVLGKFRQKYPFIKTELWRAGGSEVREKVFSEARAGVYNVDITGADLEDIIEARKLGLMKKHDWPNTRDWAPGRYRDSEGYWVARHVLVAVSVYNTQSIPPAEAPKGWSDLLNPKWKGEISIPKDFDWAMMLWSAWGKEKTASYLKEFAKNKPVVGAGHNARAELLAAGAMKIDMRINLSDVLEYQGKGAPIEWVRADPIISKGTPMFIAERAPHPNAAVLFADWFTSLEGQKAYHDATGTMMPHPALKTRLTEVLKGLNLAPTPADIALQSREIAKIYGELFWK
ncbi:MAG: extracellular solute-binding protein [Deltaproteobacteria bacterium]|nr:extracellular solute-binding protein [Deltaproteobacteria bacterium]